MSVAAANYVNPMRLFVLGLVSKNQNPSLYQFVHSRIYDSRVVQLVGDFFDISFARSIVLNFTEIVKRHINSSDDLSSLIPSNENDRLKAAVILKQGIWYPPQYCMQLNKFGFYDQAKSLICSGNTYTGYMDPQFFSPVRNDMSLFGKEMCAFIINSGVDPSDALESLDSNLCLLDCSPPRDIAVYKTLLSCLGKKKFNRIFAADSMCPLQIGTYSKSPLNRLFRPIVIKNVEDIFYGDFVHFANIYWYPVKHPLGTGGAYNLICNSRGSVRTFLGLGLNSGGVTVDQLELQLVEEFNEKPFSLDIFHFKIRDFSVKRATEAAAEVRLRDDQVINRICHDQFKKIPSVREARRPRLVKGKLSLEILRPRNDLVRKLIETPLEDVESVFRDFLEKS